jgi:predicted transcriptional regulator
MNIPNKEFNVIAKNDIISYLSIKAYINWLGKKGFVNVLKTLKGALIYPSLQEKENPDFKNIAAIIRNLRQNTNNYMVNEFLRYVEANDETNKGNINKAVSNIWARLSENEQQRLYDSFIDLYNSEKTKADAIALFNYLLVKDGGQFRSGSFIKYIPPFAFKDLLDRTKEINEMFANNDETEENYMRIFGVSREELLTNFMLGYGTHILNRNNIKSIVPTVVMDMDIQVKEGENIADINKEEENSIQET